MTTKTWKGRISVSRLVLAGVFGSFGFGLVRMRSSAEAEAEAEAVASCRQILKRKERWPTSIADLGFGPSLRREKECAGMRMGLRI